MSDLDELLDTARCESSTPRGGIGRRILRVAGWSVAGVAVVALGAVAVTALLDGIDRRRIAPPGELVELADGRLLHLHVVPGPASEAIDRPTIVLEAGSGGSAAAMAWLHRRLGERTKVIAYDRAGYGFSDASNGPLDAASVVADLHQGLAALGVPGPYVLVGHSLGGGYVRAFAAAHPDEVVGLVLLDPVHERQLERLPAESIAELEQARSQLAVAPALARLGVFRLLDPQERIVASLPPDAGEQHRARSVTAAGMRAYGREVAAFPALLDEIGRADGAATTAAASQDAFRGVPVRVISASEPAERETRQGREVMDALHGELTAHSPTASHAVIEGSDHLSLVIDAEYAREVATIILGLLEELSR
jgi:pimeloyl-ACP methyl ester carboxylesterase